MTEGTAIPGAPAAPGAEPGRLASLPPGETLLNVRDLRVAFAAQPRPVLAVDGVSFRIGRGETVALVGESGSGKSVSALSVLRLLNYPAASHPTGEIYFGGRNLLKVSDERMREVRGKRISMIFQEPMTSLNPLHTIERQVGEVLEIHQGLAPDAVRARTLELLIKVGIRDPESRLDAYPHQLSGGQRQRVMIATALANSPDLLIADEPTTALDVTIQAQILDLLADLKRELGMAMLLITHDLGIVGKMADRVYVMRAGKIVEEGPAEEVLTRPQHPYTRMLITAEPKGRPPEPDSKRPVVVSADNLKVYFPIKRGLLRKVVGHIKAVDGVTLQIREGETLGVVGESGSGKTTLGLGILRLVSSDGPIVVLGQQIDGLSRAEVRPLRRKMQIVFQDPYGSLSPRLSVGQIIEEGLVILNRGLKRGERRERVAAALADVGLDPGAMDRFPHEFSGGQRQRIAVARAMVLDPRFVMLDEPTSALDRSVQAQIVDLLRDLQAKRNLAYLFISHDLKVVRALSHHIIVMRGGKVVEEGPAERVFNSPREDYTKALLAAALDLKVSKEQAAAVAT